MKTIDFTKPGGFPLTQDQLDYLQQAYIETVSALSLLGNSGGPAPVLISGMALSYPSAGAIAVADGWFLYNGEMVRFTASSVSGLGMGTEAYVVIAATAGTLTYNDGSTPAVILDKTATVQALPTGTPTDAFHFLLSALTPFGKGFGINNREQNWNSIAVSTAPAVGGVTGTVYFKKDFTANTLHIRGFLFANNAQNFAASPGATFVLMATLPAIYIPYNNTYFTGHYYVSSMVTDDLGIAWIKQITCGLSNTGLLYVNWVRPEISVSSYGINFNVILPLD